MEDPNYNDYYEEENNKGPHLPISQESGLNFQSLLKLNQAYAKQLLNIVSSASKNMRKLTKLVLPYNDMKVLNSLLKEDFAYLVQLLKFNQFKYEFDALYVFSIKILNLLGEMSNSKINLYQKIQKLKFMELKFQSLRISGTDNDFSGADSLLDEMEEIIYDQKMKDYVTILDFLTLNLNRAYVKFNVYELENAKQYALNAEEVVVKGNNMMNENFKNNKVDEEKCQKKLAQIHEFLAEIYDLQKDYEKAYDSYDKCYYFYLGRYGINNPLIEAIKKKKELFEKKKYEQMNRQQIQPKNNLVDKLKSGKITNSKGQTETFSFIIPSTKISEPLIVKIYALPKYSGDIDCFSDYLFLKNIYFDKIKLFEYFGIEDEFEQQNYILYTDDALSALLDKIIVIDNRIIQFTDDSLYDIYINC
jgi:hypothetical protein